MLRATGVRASALRLPCARAATVEQAVDDLIEALWEAIRIVLGAVFVAMSLAATADSTFE